MARVLRLLRLERYSVIVGLHYTTSRLKQSGYIVFNVEMQGENVQEYIEAICPAGS